jgi:hypothetical protein
VQVPSTSSVGTESALGETKQIIEKQNSKTTVVVHVTDIVDEVALKEAAKGIGS